jgi:uncharacterized protein with PIN domain
LITGTGKMKLLADSMLGRLAKWLRILGYDTAYLPDGDALAVMRQARAEDRIILTRDRELARRQGFRTLLITGKTLEEKLLQVWADVGPPSDVSASRCPVCNHPLFAAEPEIIAARLPLYVQKTHKRFAFCNACDRLFWQGTHWDRIRSLIAELHDEVGFDTIQSAD